MQSIIATLTRWSPADAPPFEAGWYSEIEDLEEACGGPLPAAYFEFLRFAGRSLGALEVGHAEMRLPQILERYALLEWTPPPPLICIGLDRNPLARASYYLDRSRPWGTDDCAVVRFPLPQRPDTRWQDQAWIDFVALRELLLYWGFLSLRARGLAQQSLLPPEHATPQQQQAILAALEHWPVARLPEGEVCRVYDGPALAVLVQRNAETSALQVVRLAAHDARELRIRAEMLIDLGMKPWR